MPSTPLTADRDPRLPADGHRVAIVGGGPAGLMAAEVLSAAGVAVDLYDAMASVGRKFLLAGRGGLNLTHAETADRFAARYAERQPMVEALLRRFGALEVRAWAQGLGIETFVGSSGRVFPIDMKAAPLLRAWLHRLRAAGVRFHMRHRWTGWASEVAEGGHELSFDTPRGQAIVHADAVLLALGGASWSRLGSDGAWLPWLAARGIEVEPLVPSNCGFDVATAHEDGTPRPGWSDHFRTHQAGVPVKNVALRCEGPGGRRFEQVGEFVITEGGVEGSLVYAASAPLRDAIAVAGRAVAYLDLLPGRSAEWVRREVAQPRGSRSLSTHLKSRLGLDGVKAALLREQLPRAVLADPVALAAAIQSLLLVLAAPRPIDEAISSAGGVRFEALDERLMSRALPGLFCAGEMLDWEAPTGGYLLTASLASGAVAGEGVRDWLRDTPVAHSRALPLAAAE